MQKKNLWVGKNETPQARKKGREFYSHWLNQGAPGKKTEEKITYEDSEKHG